MRPFFCSAPCLLALGMFLQGCGRPGPQAPPGEGLEVGMLAPEIDGEDLDGARFRLSEYRGMVVVLDFWGNW
jgi:hypothetical protein